MTTVIARCGLACALLLLCAPPAAAVPGRTRAGFWLAAQLQAGHRLILQGVRIEGPVNLNNVGNVRSTFECHSCVFTGTVTAHDVVFERLVDLAGSRFSDDVDFTGARFEGPALFRAALADDSTNNPGPCRFRKHVVFALASFDDLASFGRTNFCFDADFRDARFNDATFSHSSFTEARFERAAFRGTALFNDATFGQHASFEEADFRVRADFARSEFDNGADFGAARFGGGASFLAATFSVLPGDQQLKRQERRRKRGEPVEP
ncbi:MAG: pentapeptide repeat-containing protein, partial [Gaiellaceae bacterium]